MLKNKLTLFLSMLLVIVPLASASMIDDVAMRIVSIGNLSFLGMTDGALVVGLTRLLIWVLVFTICFALLSSLSGKEGKSLNFFKKNQVIVVAFVLATVSAIFLPAQVLMATGVGWATAVAFLLIGGPIVGLVWMINLIPWDGKETRATLFLKLMLCLLLFWILTAMKYHVGKLGGGF